LGASGIFLKHDPPGLLAQSIRDVAQGRNWFNEDLLKELVHGEPPQSGRPLTERERAVLRSVVEGLSSKEIGGKMSISESAVKAVLQQLFNKTGVRTRSQLVRVALEQYHGEF
jgi:two-component system, NarL family, nitrate/nitrite response regulator NarL